MTTALDLRPLISYADQAAPRVVPAALEVEHSPEGDGPKLPRPYRLYSAAELDELPAAAWLVDQAIPENGLVGVIGAKGQLKTFVVLDLAAHIAAGFPWQEREVQQGAGVYVYAEGPFGAKMRLNSWCEYQGYARGEQISRASLPLWFLPSRIPINNPTAVAALTAEISALPVAPRFIVVDTLNQNLDGDEDGKGMGAFVAGCSRLRECFGVTVFAVHHSPLGDDGRARGHSSFDGALDTRLLVTRDSDRVTLECTHQRNGPDGWSVAFEAIPIAGSLALKPSGLNAGELKGQRRDLLELLHSQDTLSYKDWLAASELKPSSFKKARKWLLANAYVRQAGKKYVATEAGIQALGHQGYSEGHHD